MSEAQEQIAFIKWLRYFHPKLTVFHIPNGENRDIVTAMKLRSMGVMPGVPDLYCLDYHLWMEHKLKEGQLSKNQLKFKKLAERTGHKFLMFNGFEDAVQKFTNFIGKYNND